MEEMRVLEVKTLDEIENSINKSSADSLIPKNIFQTWETEEVPQIVFDRVQKMTQDNPEWNYYFFNKNLRREFIQKHFDESVLSAYDNLIPGSYKVDLWQFCILSKFGGFYLDMKCMPLIKINQILDSSSAFIASRDRYLEGFAGDFYIICGYLASRVDHCFLKKAIELIVYNVRNGYYGSDALLPTGPGLLGRAINSSLNLPENNTISPGVKKHNGEFYTIFPVADFEENCIKDSSGNSIIDLGYGQVQDSLNNAGLKVYQFLKMEFQTGFMHYQLYKSLKKTKRTHQAHYSILWMCANIYHKQHNNQQKKYLRKQFRSFRWYYYNCVAGDILMRCWLKLTNPFQSINTGK